MKTLKQAIKDNRTKQERTNYDEWEAEKIRKASAHWNNADLKQGFCKLVSK